MEDEISKSKMEDKIIMDYTNIIGEIGQYVDERDYLEYYKISNDKLLQRVKTTEELYRYLCDLIPREFYDETWCAVSDSVKIHLRDYIEGLLCEDEVSHFAFFWKKHQDYYYDSESYNANYYAFISQDQYLLQFSHITPHYIYLYIKKYMMYIAAESKSESEYLCGIEILLKRNFYFFSNNIVLYLFQDDNSSGTDNLNKTLDLLFMYGWNPYTKVCVKYIHYILLNNRCVCIDDGEIKTTPIIWYIIPHWDMISELYDNYKNKLKDILNEKLNDDVISIILKYLFGLEYGRILLMHKKFNKNYNCSHIRYV